jgi:hypothetical protein
LNFADLLFGFSIFYAFVALFFKFKNRISYGLVNISIPHIQTDPYPASSKTPRAVKLLQEQTLNHWSSRVVFFTPRSDLFFLHKSHEWKTWYRWVWITTTSQQPQAVDQFQSEKTCWSFSSIFRGAIIVAFFQPIWISSWVMG